MLTTIEQRRMAAVTRAQKTRARADRPSHRRSDEAPDSSARVAARILNLELRESGEGSDVLVFDGYASITGTPYEMYDCFGPYIETVTPGAFFKTLSYPKLDVPFVLAHQQLRRIARTTNGTLWLKEDDQGLNVLANLDPADQDVAYIAPKLRAGLIDEMSFCFRITDGTWNDTFDEFTINEVDLHRGDVAIVGFGANPYTAGSGLVAKAAGSLSRALPPGTARGVDLITEADVRIRV